MLGDVLVSSHKRTVSVFSASFYPVTIDPTGGEGGVRGEETGGRGEGDAEGGGGGEDQGLPSQEEARIWGRRQAAVVERGASAGGCRSCVPDSREGF